MTYVCSLTRMTPERIVIGIGSVDVYVSLDRSPGTLDGGRETNVDVDLGRRCG